LPEEPSGIHQSFEERDPFLEEIWSWSSWTLLRNMTCTTRTPNMY
jgi:hypothetical protein